MACRARSNRTGSVAPLRSGTARPGRVLLRSRTEAGVDRANDGTLHSRATQAVTERAQMNAAELLNEPFDHLPPEAESTFEGHRAFGYDLATALADLVDNSITGGARQVWLDFEW